MAPDDLGNLGAPGPPAASIRVAAARATAKEGRRIGPLRSNVVAAKTAVPAPWTVPVAHPAGQATSGAWWIAQPVRVRCRPATMHAQGEAAAPASQP